MDKKLTEIISDFLKSHPAISLPKLSQEMEFNPAYLNIHFNVDGTVKRQFPERHREKVVKTLEKYGNK